VINPRHIENQIEGAIIMGIGGALFEKIEFDSGRILNGRLARYRVPRFSDVPPIETILMDRKDIQPAGAGETPIVGIAPAIGNAIFDATGTRLRSMPMSL
jgi:nicotinate dehydrogenase subunit B